MRLGQLARKLEIRSSEIVDFLSRHNIQIEDGSNTRIEDDHTTLVIRHFNPALLEAIPEVVETVEVHPEVVEQVQPIAEVTVTIVEENINPEPVLEMSSVTTEHPSPDTSVEVIKATKAELPGLKVLGKIELPEAKKKETVKPAEEVTIENQTETPLTNRPARQERRPARNNQPRRDEQWKNPIALQREREAREAEEKRKAQLELEKEKRMVHYLKKVKKTDQPVKNVRLENEDNARQVKLKEVDHAPKTWLGKVIRWFSTPTR